MFCKILQNILFIIIINLTVFPTVCNQFEFVITRYGTICVIVLVPPYFLYVDLNGIINLSMAFVVVSLQTLNELLSAGDVTEARNAFLTQVSVSCIIRRRSRE